MVHELKLATKFFEEALKGRKPFEIRYDDRGYKVGDDIILKEYDDDYTGREISGRITYILTDIFVGLKPGYVAFTYETESKERSTETVNKNEYIALELTKMWSGQSGLPAPASQVLEKYKSFRDELNKEGDND